MSRSRRKIGARKPAIAFVLEGETEMWYLQMLKKNEQRERNVRINIRPEIPQKKRLKDQYKMVCELAEDHKVVFWILDLDVVLKQTREHSKGGKRPLDEFIEYRSKLLKKYKNVKVVVNNPCFEYWFLLHYVCTHRRYPNCSGVIKDLKKNLAGYKKTERYFKNRNKDIYSRLKPNLEDAIENAISLGSFDIENPKKAMCEMNELFDELKQ
ncbi:MAG: RloB domain-containing protein [Bacteroidales bacterium]|nr:RloB domain-containing protein [Bacteroidales bacterium]